jgi:hypothetical protein
MYLSGKSAFEINGLGPPPTRNGQHIHHRSCPRDPRQRTGKQGGNNTANTCLRRKPQTSLCCDFWRKRSVAMRAGRTNKRLLAVGSKGALDTFGAEEEIGEMVGGAVGAISAIDRLDHLADLEG